MERRVQILTQTEVKRALMRLSYEIIEKSEDLDKVVLAGIHTRGIPISEILRDNIEKNTGKRLPLCTLDITFYRDDLSKKREIPEVKGSLFPVDINGKEVIICDDVLYTGRTCRAAIDSIFAPTEVGTACMPKRLKRFPPPTASASSIPALPGAQ